MHAMHVIAGFDISSSTIGYGVLLADGQKIVSASCGYHKPVHLDTTISSLMELYHDINHVIEDIKKQSACYHVKPVTGVENFLLAHPKTSANTITKLVMYNTAMCLYIYSSTGVEPFPYAVSTIRARLRRLSGIPKIGKEDVPDAVEKIISSRMENGWKFPYVLDKKGKRIVENSDVADGIAVALTAAHDVKAIS